MTSDERCNCGDGWCIQPGNTGFCRMTMNESRIGEMCRICGHPREHLVHNWPVTGRHFFRDKAVPPILREPT